MALSFFGKHTASIEINRNNTIYKLFFPKLPHCVSITEELKNEFQQNVSRTSLNAKVTSLVNLSDEIIDSLYIDSK